MEKYSAAHIADILLRKAADSEQEYMSNLKLQKMLYYEQGFHLAVFHVPLFDEEIEAWMYGPVVPAIYEKFSVNGKKGIEPPPNVLMDLKGEQAELFDEVFDTYNQFSAAKLVEMTHGEPPWKNVDPKRGQVISKESMRAFFATRLR